jgi:hypothetical protein
MPITTPPTAPPFRAGNGPSASRQFECVIDRSGNIHMAAGTVVNARQGQVFNVADKAVAGARQARPDQDGARTFAGPRASVFLGGNGRNIKATTSGGTLVPVGLFKPTIPDTFEGTFAEGKTIIFNAGAGTARITDGTIDLATGTGFTIAPVGTFNSTSAGATAYNGGAAFTVTTTLETGGSVPGCLVSATSSLIDSDEFTAVSVQEYEGNALSGWFLTIDDAGVGLINDGSSDVAERASGPPDDPSGVYVSTTYGATTWGDDETEFTMHVQVLSSVPVEGWVYCSVTESAPGVIASVSGPFFAASVPDNARPVFYVPIAYSDGDGNLQQFQEGAIQWGGFETIPWVTITSADFLALDPPDTETIYDIYDP